MSIETNHLYNLLPAVYRERDAANGGVLRQYLEVLSDELAVVADGIDQLYDDLFVETAAPWVLPYLADLVGLRGVNSGTGGGLTPRAEVANTIAYRRRKGTAAVLEQLARDTTGWPARAVEFFELVATCQHMNHIRPANQATVSVRNANRLEFVGSAFERGRGTPDDPDLIHLADVRRIPPRRGRYNIPNVGIFLWRLRAYPATRSPALPAVAGDQHRFLLCPLGAPVQLFSSPLREDEITHLAEPANVPLPLTRRLMASQLAAYYGPGLSVHVPGVAASDVTVCDLRDIPGAGGSWAHTPAPAGRVHLDPVLGRLAFGDPIPSPPPVSYHYGFSAELGGGEYDRTATFATIAGPIESVAQGSPAAHATIAAALAALGPSAATVEVLDSGRYVENLTITATAASIELRAADGRRPTLLLSADLRITLSGDAEVSLNGLLISGGAIRVLGAGRLILRHCTLVPGLALDAAGLPVAPDTPSLHVESGETTVSIERCILGGIRSHVDAELTVTDSILDAGEDGIAIASVATASTADAAGPGGLATIGQCTVLGRVHVRQMELASNSIFLGFVPAGGDARWPGPILVDRRQDGCARFCYFPAGARTPRRYHCVPDHNGQAAEFRPVLVSSRYGEAGYCQLDHRTQDAVRRGAEDESEMGAFWHLHQPQREAYLRARLDEYLRFGLEAGLFFAT